MSDDSDDGDRQNHDHVLRGHIEELLQQSSGSDCDVPQNDDDLMPFSCKCLRNCLTHFERSELISHILNIRELNKDEKELMIMGVLQKVGKDDLTTKKKTRKRIRYVYKFKGVSVCHEAFQIIYDITDHVLDSLMKHVNSHGIVPRVHGNTGRTPKHSLVYDDIVRAVDFIKSFADEHGLHQPAAPRGEDGPSPIFLPVATTKRDVHKQYKDTCVALGVRAMEISAFESIWLKCVPHIQICSPKTDVCQTCELTRKEVYDARTEDDKLVAARKLQEHILDAQKERQHYRQCIVDAVREMEETICPGDTEPTVDHVHYTFDFAQQFSIPHHSRQMGPLYFLSGRKVQLFGVRVDGISRQANYLIDEDQTIGMIYMYNKL